MVDLITLHWPQDGAHVLDLCQWASDDVKLETGAAPDMAYARNNGAICPRIAVLDTNPIARKFWTTLGFRHEKSTKAADGPVRNKASFSARLCFDQSGGRTTA